MPKKRTSPESNEDEQTSEGSCLFQEDDDAKRARLASLYDTTLQDLPVEILECILVKVVVMEVKGMKLAKCVWKEKADLVISRLRTVCSQWSSILTTGFFTRELHRTLDGTGQEMIRLEILHQPSIQFQVLKVITLKDEILLLCCPDRGCFVMNVYDRNNMAEVKDVIPLPGILPRDMAACSVSNCVYLLDKEKSYPSIFRIAKDEKHHFKKSPWIYDMRLQVSKRAPISVSTNGDVIILSCEESAMFGPDWPVDNLAYGGIYIYGANGSLKRKIMLSSDFYWFTLVNSVIQKSNGNLVLLSDNNENKAKLLEINKAGEIVRQYESSLDGCSVVSIADIHGRILINDYRNRIELLDSELNPLEISGPRLSEDHLFTPPQIHFNSERNEIARIEMRKFNSVNGTLEATVLNIFRFTEG